MKKIFTLASLVLLSAGIAGAQDLEKATNLAKDANDALMAGNFQIAIDGFQAAFNEVNASTDEGAEELKGTCKQGLTQANYAFANNLVKEGKITEAIAQSGKTISAARALGEDEIAEKAKELKYQLHQAYANQQIKAAGAATDPAAKKAAYLSAAENLDSVLVNSPDNGKAYLSKGQILAALGKKDDAISCYEKAKEVEPALEASANKQIGTFYLKDASAMLKAQKYKEAVAAAAKSLEYGANANAYKIAGIASQKAGDLIGAVTYLEKYLELKPGDAQISNAVNAIKAQIK